MPTTLKLLKGGSFGVEPATPRRWLWGDYLASGAVTLLTGRWKGGKTTLLSSLLAKCGTGTTLCGGVVAATRAVIVSEEPEDLWGERDRRLGFGDDVGFCCRPFFGRPTMAEWVEFNADLAARKPDLVAFDPVSMFLPGAAEGNSAAMLAALEPLRRLTTAGAAVLLVHHPRKARRAGDTRPRGPAALPGFADILVKLEPLPGAGPSDRRRVLSAESRLRGASRRVIELAADGRDYGVLPEPQEQTGFGAGWEMLQSLLEDLPPWPTRKAIRDGWPADEIRPAANTLARWLDRGVREGLLEVTGSGGFRDPLRYALAGAGSP